MLLYVKAGGIYSYHCALKGCRTRLCVLSTDGELVLVGWACNVCLEPDSLRWDPVDRSKS
jgi:hypothetical protein